MISHLLQALCVVPQSKLSYCHSVNWSKRLHGMGGGGGGGGAGDSVNSDGSQPRKIINSVRLHNGDYGI